MKKKTGPLLLLIFYFVCTQIYADRPGLQNLGNSCYFNSTIQCLASCKPLNDLLKKNSTQYEKESITSKYLSLIDEIHAEKDRNTETTSSPLKNLHDTLIVPKWRYSQKDLPECLRLLNENFLDRSKSAVDAILKCINKEDQTLAQKITFFVENNIDSSFSLEDFYNRIAKWITSGEMLIPASMEDKKYFDNEPIIKNYFTFMSEFKNTILPFSEETIQHEMPDGTIHKGESQQQPLFPISLQFKPTLEESFDSFCEDEELSIDNQWTCEACNKKVANAKKAMRISNASTLLIIQLKRFKDGNLKIDDPASFPITLKIKPEWVGHSFKGELPTYSLIAFSTHGGGTGSGHYWAHAKDWRDGKWYSLNDSSSSSITEKEASQETSAYVLYYQKTDTLLPVSTNALAIRGSITAKQPTRPTQSEPTQDLQEALTKLTKSFTALKGQLNAFSEKLSQLNTQLKTYNS